MAEKFQNKYRIPSARLKDWDYGSDGIYFVTPCTQHHEHYFGKIVDGEMMLNEIGKLAQDFWIEIPNHFSFVKLHSFVIMPNHVHGLIEISKGGMFRLATSTNDKWNPGVLGVIINQYKRICTLNARKINSQFTWQTRFHDHIVRDFEEYHRIEQYMQNNPRNWEDDCFYYE